MKKNKRNIILFQGVFYVVIVIVLASQIIFLAFSVITDNMLRSNLAKAQEASRPAELELIVISDEACVGCVDMESVVAALKNESISIISERSVDRASQEGEALLKQYGINKVPTILLQGELHKNVQLAELLPKIGAVNDDGTFVLSQTGMPYHDLKNDRIVGALQITMLEDRQCAECYDVTVHKKILANYGYRGNSYSVVDISSGDGRELLSKYMISLIPTIVITGDIDSYPEIQKIWDSLGTRERDGALVMRDQVKFMGVYKDLSTGKVIKPEQNNTSTNN